MNTKNLQVAELSKLERLQPVFMQAKEDESPLRGTFLGAIDEQTISVALNGSSTGLPFLLDEWQILVPKLVPLPNVEDIDTMILNAVRMSRVTGIPTSSEMLAEQIMGLLRGEIETPVQLIPLPEPPQQEPEASAIDPETQMPDGSPRPV